MIAWLIVLLLLILINSARIGVWGEYSEDGFALSLYLAFFKMKVLPAKIKTPEESAAAEEKKQKKEQKAAAKAERKRLREAKRAQKRQGTQGTPEGAQSDVNKKRKNGGPVDLILSILPPAFDAVGVFIRRLRVTHLRVYYTSAGSDPFDSAMAFGYVSAAMGVITPILETMRIRDRDLRTDVDFSLDKPIVYVEAQLTMALWEYLYIVFRLAFKFIFRYIKRTYRRRRRAAERV